MRRRVQELVDISICKGDKLKYRVEDWVKEADTQISKAHEFLQQQDMAKKTCCKIALCGTWGNLHGYDKSAAKMVLSLVQLQERGSTYESSVVVENPAPGSLDVYQSKNLEDLVIHNTALNAIIVALEDESKQIIGIYGFGGVGKSTLGMEVAVRLKKTNMLFADVAFATITQIINAEKIQKDLKNATERIMKGDKILIILDDIWEKLDLLKLGIPNNHSNCKILLTSRSEKVCQEMNAQSIIYVDSLPREEAWILFKHVVGERVETEANLKPVAEDVAKHCGGLPLLIQAIGYALKHKSIDSWKSALSLLKEPAPWLIDDSIEKTFAHLQLNYDCLRSAEARSCFFLCSLFHEAEDIELEELVRYVVGLELFDDLDSIEDVRGRVQNAVNILTSSGLLLNVEDDKGCTKMHKVVRDMALSVGSEVKNRYLLKAGKDLIEWLPRDNNVKDLTEYKTNFDDFLESYDSMIRMLDEMAPFRAVSKATNHYHVQNIIKDGEYGKMLKFSRNGRLMYIVVRSLHGEYGENDIGFRREHAILSALKHNNISSILEYLDEDGENIVAYEHAFHGILHGHLSNPALTWSRRLQICLGVARALNYIHNRGLIHCDINSSKILLDEDWKPKIFGFELSTEYPQSWKHRLHLSGQSGYLGAASVMTPKYDVHLFGELLIEILHEKKPNFGEDGFKDENIDPSLRKHIGSQSMKFFKNIAYNCLVKKLVERPSMNQIVKDLEEALKLQQKEENLVLKERSTNGGEGASRDSLLLDVMEISLIDIKNATGNFTKGGIGYGGFGTVYKAILIESVSSKGEPPMKISKTVAIKRLSKNGDEQAEERFLTEIKSLTSCIHPNVVSLLGFSKEANERILVFEYATKGDLSDYLRTERSQTWSQRLQICLQVARGINCLHTNNIIHRDIKSKNILLDENLNAKVADFGLSTLIPSAGDEATILSKNVEGTTVYIDPEYRTTGGYKKESDIYAFGVVLFEVLSGKMAYDTTYMREYDDGLAPIVRRRFEEGTLTELIDPKMFEEDDEHTFTLNKGPTKDCFDLFSKVGYECLAKTRAERPKMEAVIKTLEDALEVQGKTMKLSRFPLSVIEDASYMGLDTSGNKIYKAQLDHFESNSLLAAEGTNNGEQPAKRRISVAIKRVSVGRVEEHNEERFFSEIEMHTRYKHDNIVPLLGICYEHDNMLLVYEHAASEESLEDYLTDTDNMNKHTWIERLHLCLGIARGLDHLHTLMDLHQGKQHDMIHADIRSANILLGKTTREVKIAYFGFSKLLPPNQEASTKNDVRTKVYCCPENYDQKTIGEPKKQSDIYSFGVVLFEIFCGRLAYDPFYTDKNDNGLAPIARQSYSDGTIKEMIDPSLKEETLQSSGPYLRIANQCLAEKQAERPTVQSVIKELEMALNIPVVALQHKTSEEWMLDYALQTVVGKLTPARKRKVALLVKAFEDVVPAQDDPQEGSSNEIRSVGSESKSNSKSKSLDT
uniref:uncharacterized protein LOC122606606 isoform X2 n=1 Tax=Erigeron canadensis TaxID=72917 RepID=UPI001CB89313|nr:uncharacterized protein LOC122606606 isoform X2 [Erigeron canadensis]